MLSGLLNTSFSLYNPDTSKQRRLFMNIGLSCQMSISLHYTDIFPLNFCLLPEMINCHFILLASQRQHGRLQVLMDICHWMEGIFRGSKSFHLATFPFPSLLGSTWLFTECISHLSTNQWRLFVSFPKSKEQRTDGEYTMTCARFRFGFAEWGKLEHNSK